MGSFLSGSYPFSTYLSLYVLSLSLSLSLLQPHRQLPGHRASALPAGDMPPSLALPARFSLSLSLSLSLSNISLSLSLYLSLYISLSLSISLYLSKLRPSTT
jgi:hypothetical protein